MRPCQSRCGGLRRGRSGQGLRYGGGFAAGPRLDYRERAALARDGRLRRRAGGVYRGTPGAGHAGVRGGERRRWLHGETGSEAGPGLIAEDLPEALRMVYRRLFVDLGVWP